MGNKYNAVTPPRIDTAEASTAQNEHLAYADALGLGDFAVRVATEADSHHDDGHTIHEQFPQTD